CPDGEPARVAADRLAVDQARARLEPRGGFQDGGEAPGPVLAVPGQEPDAGHVAAHHQAIAVMLDLVNPVRPRWGMLGGRWEAGFDEFGRKPGRRATTYEARLDTPWESALQESTRLTSWGLAIMERRNGTLRWTGRIAEADSDLHCRSNRKDRARRGGCIRPGDHRGIYQVACAACRASRA